MLQNLFQSEIERDDHPHFFFDARCIVSTVIAGIVAADAGDLNDSLTGDAEFSQFASRRFGDGMRALVSGFRRLIDEFEFVLLRIADQKDGVGNVNVDFLRGERVQLNDRERGFLDVAGDDAATAGKLIMAENAARCGAAFFGCRDRFFHPVIRNGNVIDFVGSDAEFFQFFVEDRGDALQFLIAAGEIEVIAGNAAGKRGDVGSDLAGGDSFDGDVFLRRLLDFQHKAAEAKRTADNGDGDDDTDSGDDGDFFYFFSFSVFGVG